LRPSGLVFRQRNGASWLRVTQKEPPLLAPSHFLAWLSTEGVGALRLRYVSTSERSLCFSWAERRPRAHMVFQLITGGMNRFFGNALMTTSIFVQKS
jgi:hypothetical protein